MIKNFLVKFLLVLFPLLIIEIFCAIFFLMRPNPSISFLLKPFLDVDKIKFETRIEIYDHKTNKYKPGQYITKENIKYNINSSGFRGPEYDHENKPECLGIAYGGSTTVGLEVEYEYTYPRLVEKKLNNIGYDCKFLNFGVSSKSLKYIFKRLIKEIEFYNPNYVIIYNNRNSAMYDSTTLEINSDIATNRKNLILFKTIHFLENNLMFYKFLRKVYLRILESRYETPHPSDLTRKININYFNQGYLNLLEQIYKFLDKRNINLILVKQIRYSSIDDIDQSIQINLQNKDIKYNIELLKKYNKLDLKLMTNTSKLNLKEKENNFFLIANIILNQNMDILSKKYQDIILVDALDIFYNYKKDATTNDGIHLNKLGTDILSSAIVSEILKKN